MTKEEQRKVFETYETLTPENKLLVQAKISELLAEQEREEHKA